MVPTLGIWLAKDYGFTNINTDEFVLYYNKSVPLAYVNDSILIGPERRNLNNW
jgi:hypothetical protein